MEEFRIVTTEQLTPKSPEDWLWCLYCNRFFQAKHLAPDGIANESCPHCGAGGIGVAVFPWDHWRGDDWPRSTDELRFGMHCS